MKSLVDEVGATARLIASIDAGRACAALLLGWQHWVVIGGYLYDDPSPTWPPDSIGGKNINALQVYDPASSVAQRFMPCATWWNNFGVVPCGSLKNRYVIIVPPPPKPPKPPVPDAIVPAGPSPPPPPPHVSPLLVSVDALIETANRSVQQLLTSAVSWKIALAGATPATPLLVRRIDKAEEYFYIVPFQSKGGVTARILVDARTGRFIEAGGIQTAGQTLPTYVDPAQVLRKLATKVETAQSRVGAIRPETVSVHHVLVWKPCAESPTPYLPFYVLTDGDRVLYLRTDGEIFTKLTESAPGL